MICELTRWNTTVFDFKVFVGASARVSKHVIVRRNSTEALSITSPLDLILGIVCVPARDSVNVSVRASETKKIQMCRRQIKIFV